MGSYRTIIASVIIAIVPLLAATVVEASPIQPSTPLQTVSQTQIITITAQVANQITVVVDTNGTISQIFSNSNQKAAPVFVKNTLDGPRVQPNEGQLEKYKQLMSRMTIAYGSLYEKPMSPNNSWLSLLLRPVATIGS